MLEKVFLKPNRKRTYGIHITLLDGNLNRKKAFDKNPLKCKFQKNIYLDFSSREKLV